MKQRAIKISKLVTDWFSKKSGAESFEEYKKMKQEEIWEAINTANFRTPDDAFRLCHLLLAKKIAVDDIEEQKRKTEQPQ